MQKMQQGGRWSQRMSTCVLGASLGVSSFGVQSQMAMPGQFAVAPSGAATYSIPIQVPSGLAGMEPKLALTYNSQASNGLVGFGWSLAGLSSIARCSQTKTQDGPNAILGVNYTLTDRYCLDGQRLLASVSGNDGANGAEYRTEIDGYAKITSYSETGASNGPGSFIVKTKSGLTMEYGKTSDSRVEASGKTVVAFWALNKVCDAKNNCYTASYTENTTTGQHLLSRIDYTSNTSVTPAIPASNSVVLSYEARADKFIGFRAGSLTQMLDRLQKISVYQGTNQVAAYTVSYDGTSTSRPSSIQLCTNNGSNCYPATTLTYNSTPAGFSSSQTTTNGAFGGAKFTWVGDFNGDGLSDVASAINGDVQMHLSNGSGFTDQVWPVQNLWSDGGYTWQGDFNGDGLTDIASAMGGNIYMKLSTGTGFTSQTWTVPNNWGSAEFTWAGDFNGDGLTDIATALNGNVYVYLSTGTSFTSQTWPVANYWSQGGYTWTGDFDGDGRTDIASAIGGNIYVRLARNNGFQSEIWTVDNLWGGASYTWTGDFNGDGLTDIASAYQGNVYLKLSTGTGFKSETWPVQNVWSDGGYNWVFDADNDGIPDIVSAVAGTIYVKSFRPGAGFTNKTWAVDNYWATIDFTRLGDFNGDGRMDIYGFDTNKVYVKNGANPSHLISTIQNGLNTSSISYKTLPQTLGSSYIQDLTVSLPVRRACPPMNVVNQVSSPNGVGGVGTTLYKFGNFLSHQLRGGLGFQWVQTQDQVTSLVSRTCYRQDWPYVGMVDKVMTATTDIGLPGCSAFTGYNDLSQMTPSAGSNLLSLSLNAYKFLSYAPSDTSYATPITCTDDKTQAACNLTAATAPGQRYQIWGFQSLTQSRDWDGTNFIALPASRTTVKQDNWGNVTEVKAETLNADGSTPSGYSKTTTNTYMPVDTTNWQLGRLQKSQVQAVSP